MPAAAVATASRKRRKPKRGYAGPACPQCNRTLGAEHLVDGQQRCRTCDHDFTAYRLSPLPERATVVTALATTVAATPCARHERNVSVASCGRCGVFMCQLCRIDSDGLVLCPGCFERLADEGTLPSARKSYRDYGRMASHLALLGFFLMWPLGVLIGPFAMWMGVKGLRTRAQPGVHISKARCITAIVLGIIETVVWFAIVAAIVWAVSQGKRS